MQILNMKRGQGKTTALMYASAITGRRIVTATRKSAEYINDRAEYYDIKIPKAMSIEEFISFNKANHETEIYVDEIDWVFDQMLYNICDTHVGAATITTDKRTISTTS